MDGSGWTYNMACKSSDLNLIDFYVWRHLLSVVYATPVDDLKELTTKSSSCMQIKPFVEQMACLSMCEDLR